MLGWSLDQDKKWEHIEEHNPFAPIHVLTFLYGSKHQDAESAASKNVVGAWLARYPESIVSHHLWQLPPEFFSGSALVDDDIPLPQNRTIEEMTSGEPAPSYVPARNSIFLSLAAGRADAWECDRIAYAAHYEDSPGYPDCTPQYLYSMQRTIQLGTARRVSLVAPFIMWSKSDIILLGSRLRAPLHLTHSCYAGTTPACGVCDTCILRIESFKKASIKDPIEYAIPIDWSDCDA